MELAIKIFQFVLSISILVLLHELGHFLPAKWFGTRAEKFFLFFDPYFSLFSMKKINGKWQYRFLSKNDPDTEKILVEGKEKEIPLDISKLPETDWRRHPESTKYGIGWLPMGGYVKIAGMVDESMDKAQLQKPPQPWEFRSKPAWQRLIIMLGGVTVNFFLAWAIYSCLSYFNGEHFTDMGKLENGIGVTPAGEKMGFKTGDKILKIDGKPAERLENSVVDILFSKSVTVLRDGKEQSFKVNEDGIADVIRAREAKLYISPRFPLVVKELTPAAKASGLMPGDRVVAVGGISTPNYDEVTTQLDHNKGRKIALGVVRDGQRIQLQNVQVSPEGKLGVLIDEKQLTKYDRFQQYSLLQSIPRGFHRTIEALTGQVKQFRIIFNSKIQGYKSVGGPIAIVKMMPVDKNADGSVAIDWTKFWSFTAMFSIWLAFLNLLPIPGLDGGHVMFTLWELITGKPVPQKVLENAQMIGVIFLLGLMVLVFGNDIWKLIMGKF